jgi:7,8-dihydropterin-6-yl-methyl-4-(beta-D-ribofuranosyl)aminobenzene 5'-phosphate synthase
MSSEHEHGSVRRREVICGGGGAVLGLMVATLLGGTRPVRAAGVTGVVPEIDGLAVGVVVDSYQFAVAPSRKSGNVDIQHFGWGIGGGKPPGRTLVSEFGLSMHVETRRGTETKSTLVDFGFTPEALVNNVELLGIDPAKLDALVLSHGHYDHFGGLVGFLKQHNGKLKPKLPLYVGGEEAFCSREWTGPPVKGDFGALDRKALEEANLTVTYAEGPSLVADHGFTSGQIGLASFEKVLSPSAMRIGVPRHRVLCRELHRRGADQSCHSRPVPARDRHDVQSEGTWPNRTNFVQPSWRSQRRKTGSGCVWRQEGPCGDWRVPSCAIQGGLRA